MVIIIISVLSAVILTLLVVFAVRAIRFRPTKDKQVQLDKLNRDLEPVGFAYEPKGDYFYSTMYCWQRKTGYCRLYDEGAPLFNMIMDCEPIEFSYAGKRWLIELWKGQYGITTGAEIGIYNTEREDLKTEKFTGTFYENISDAERLPLSFVLKKNNKAILKRDELHWWVTAFKLGEFSHPHELIMYAKIKFRDRGMRDAFLKSLVALGYTKQEYSVLGLTVKIRYDKPHSKQPATQQGVSRAVIQQTNSNNCKLFEFATAAYSDTLDKLEFLKATMPELYDIFLKSLYSKAFFDSFKWLLDLVFGRRPDPTPPIPEPPRPPEPPSL